MQFSLATFDQRPCAKAVLIPFFQSENGPPTIATDVPEECRAALAPLLASGDFRGRNADVNVWYPAQAHDARWICVGLGLASELSTESIRRAYAAACRRCMGIKQSELVLMPIKRAPEGCERLRGQVEGLALANYILGVKKSELIKIDSVILTDGSQADLAKAKRIEAVCRATHKARDLANGSADEVTPQYLAEVAKSMHHPKVKVTILEEEQLQQEGFGLILAVGRGARHRPVLIRADYRGAPDSEDAVVIIGKGVTFDTGGLNLKPTGSIETMRDDMAGSAAALGLLQALVELEPACNVSVLIPSVENAIGRDAYKPGDVFVSYSGKSVEVTNTDAEGRLILADAISYANKHMKPRAIVDLATLTGAAIVALGYETTALMGNNDPLIEALLKAGEKSGERCWPLPLFKEYRKALDSDIADIKNCAAARAAGSIIGGIFLKDFVENTPWVHLDIAGTSFLNEQSHYGVKHATGVGVRLLAEWLGLLA